MRDRVIHRYSACFKRQVISDLESGRFDSIEAARQHYGIGGMSTIQKWLKRYGKNHLQAKVVRVEKPDEADQIRALKKKVAQLEQALGQTQAQNVLNGQYLNLACEALGEDVEAFKKKTRWDAVWGATQGSTLSVSRLCAAAGMSRANYYKQRVVRQREAVDEQLVLDLVRRERSRQAFLGGRKLLSILQPELADAGVTIGRDQLFKILSKHNLLIRLKRRSVRTTNSRHGFRAYPNLAADLVLTAPHQLWVSDITYLRTRTGFVYLALVMDAYSRAIVGYDCSDTLEVEGALRAMSMALRQRPADSKPMHHSDRGIQYSCKAYVQRLRRAGVTISMTEHNHCYENSQAERLNGTLKREYGLHDTFASTRDAQAAVREAVGLYNEYRPHQALGYRMPMQVHRGVLARVA